ncbi:sodium-independent sulfate anion transporter-like protein, partial [Leptotrombidium deliense]
MELNIEKDLCDIDEQPITIGRCLSWVHQNYFSANAIKRRFPIIQWLPGYELNEFKGDLVAGLTVGSTLIPQAIAYAQVANLPLTYGLYSSIFSAFAYAIFGSCKDCNGGPNVVQVMIIAPYVAAIGIYVAPLLAFIAGVVEIVIGLARLDFMLDFVSFPVNLGFTNAACLSVAVSQFPGFFGISKRDSKSSSGLMTLVNLCRSLEELSTSDTILGCLCIICIFVLKFTGDYAKTWNVNKNTIEEQAPGREQQRHNIFRRLRRVMRIKKTAFMKEFLILLATAKLLITLVICSIIAYYFRFSHAFKLTEYVTPGLPTFQLPRFFANFNRTEKGKVVDVAENFGDLLQTLTPVWFVIPLVTSFATAVIQKALSQSTQNPVPERLRKTIGVKDLDSSQEILTIGIANILGSCINSFPIAASLSRSIIAHTSGVKTQFANVIIGFVVLVTLSPSISSAFHYIPVTTLSSIVICANLVFITPKDFLFLYRTSLIDVILYLITFILTFTVGLPAGLLTGIVLHIVVLLAKSVRPRIQTQIMHTPNEEGNHEFGYPYVVVKPTQSIHFPAVDYLQSLIIESFSNLSELENRNIYEEDEQMNNVTKLVVVIDGQHIFHTDATFLKSFKDFVLTLKPLGFK